MSAARRCDQCGSLEDHARLIHELSSGISNRRPRDFCSDECLRDWAQSRLDERLQVNAEISDCPGGEDCTGHAFVRAEFRDSHHVRRPSPADMPTAVAS